MRVRFKQTPGADSLGIVGALGIVFAVYPCGTKSVIEIGHGPKNRIHAPNSAFEAVE